MNRGIWDFWAPRYHALWVQRVSLGPTRAAIIERFSSLPKPVRVLDVGCGTGQLYKGLRDALPHADIMYKGIDQSPCMIEIARKQACATCFAVADVDRIEPDSRPFDIILCTHAFPYFLDKRRVMAFFCRSLAPGGRLLLAQACTEGGYDRALLALVRLTTSRAQYLSRRSLLALADPFLGRPVYEQRIGSHWWLPTLRLFEWHQRRGTVSGKGLSP